MKKILLIVFVLSQYNAFCGGGWTQEKGNGFFMLSQRMISGTNYFNSNAVIVSSPALSAFTTNFYGEYGITNKLTATIYTPFLTSLSRESGIDDMGNVFIGDNATGFGDVDIALKYGLCSNKINLAVSLIGGMATGNFNAGSTGTLHLGDGEYNQMLKLDASKSFNKGIFATVFLGYNNRTKGFSDEIHYGGEVGFVKNKFIGIVKIYGRKSMFNEVRKDSPIPGIYSDNLEYFSISPQILYKLKGNIGLMAEAGFATFSRNIIAAPSLSLGVFLDFKK